MSVVDLALAHLRLVVVALAIATALGLGAGLLASRRAAASRALLALSSLIQTVPAIALLAVMVPFLAWLAERTGLAIASIGELPALVALSAYALLPIVRGLLLGLTTLDPAVVEAARAVGMSDAQRLRLVELPLATPSLLAGLRTAAVWTVGMATLGTPVGATSLGNLIFGGLQTRHFDDVLVGCGAAAGMALVLDAALGAMEARARGRHAMSSLAITLAALASAAAILVAPLLLATPERPLRIGAKSFTEQLILAEVLRCAVSEASAAPVEVRPSLGTTVAFDALVAGDLDVYVEYTGTAWTTLMGRTEHADRVTMAREVRETLAREHGVHVAARLGFENAYALVVRSENAAHRIGDLGTASTLRIGGDYEFFARDEWRDLERSYGLNPAATVTMDPSLLYEALRSGAVDVIAGYTTDGRIDTFGLRTLEDERGALPPYDAIVLVSARFAEAHPDVLQALAALQDSIDASTMRSWNSAVDSGAQTPEGAASAHLACRSGDAR